LVNILLTMRCNRSCCYCFAKEKIRSYAKANETLDISVADYETALGFLLKGGANVVQLAGGEPTLHPEFEKMLVYALEKGLYVNLLSNGLWDEEKNGFFAKISPSKIGFLLNIDRPSTYRTEEWGRIEQNLVSLKGRTNTTLSFNIFEKTPDADYIFDLLSKYGFKSVRLSFSVPVVFGDAENLAPKIEEYEAFSGFIMDFVKRAASLGVSVRMDNTVPVCMFSKSDLADLILGKVLDSQRNFSCFPPIDIGPDLRVWRCFGTSGVFNKRLEEFRSLAELYDFYELAFKAYQSKVFPMKKCYECTYAAEGVCQAGCLGFSIAHCNEVGCRPLDLFGDELLGMKVKLDPNTSLKQYSIPAVCYALENDKGIFEIQEAIKPLLDFLDGTLTVGEALDKFVRQPGTEKIEEDLLEDFLLSITFEKVLPVIRKLISEGFLVV
jgi:MoaA/NifB/PqqE/SkfB family radical SAM enzyme